MYIICLIYNQFNFICKNADCKSDPPRGVRGLGGSGFFWFQQVYSMYNTTTPATEIPMYRGMLVFSSAAALVVDIGRTGASLVVVDSLVVVGNLVVVVGNLVVVVGNLVVVVGALLVVVGALLVVVGTLLVVVGTLLVVVGALLVVVNTVVMEVVSLPEDKQTASAVRVHPCASPASHAWHTEANTPSAQNDSPRVQLAQVRSAALVHMGNKY